jgi:hypothetical protein
MRAAVSVALPAACGTISRIGWSGYSADAAVAAMTNTDVRRPSLRIVYSPAFCASLAYFWQVGQ